MKKSPFMEIAFGEAEAAAARGEVPVGAVIIGPAGSVVATAGNRTLEDADPTAHAEILAIRQAARKLGNERLIGHTIYVTLEPCAMCAAAISFARIERVIYAAGDPKMGAVEHGPRLFSTSACHHKPEVVSGIGEARARGMLQDFFRAKR